MRALKKPLRFQPHRMPQPEWIWPQSKTGGYFSRKFKVGRRYPFLVFKDIPRTVLWLLLKGEGHRRETEKRSRGVGRQGVRTQAAKAACFRKN